MGLYFKPQITAAGAGSALSLGQVQNLLIVRSTSAPGTATITADAAILINTSGTPIYFAGISLSADMTASGPVIDGRDQAGAFAAGNYIYLYLISDGSSVHSLWSLSATAPTMPTGYTYKVRISAWQCNSASTIYNWYQQGNRLRFSNTINDQTVTFSNGSSTVTAANPHGLAAATTGDNSSPTSVYFTTTGTLPTNFSPNVQYFVKTTPGASTMTVSATNGGVAISAGSAGSGTHTVHGGPGKLLDKSAGGATTATTYTLSVPTIAQGAWVQGQEASGAGIRLTISAEPFLQVVNPDIFSAEFVIISTSSNSNTFMGHQLINIKTAQTAYYSVNTGTGNFTTHGYLLPGLLS